MQETKGQATKQHILREGLQLASVKGLVNISIGGLAQKAEMSRSGLFAHFLSKEQLQLEILEYATDLFKETIINPCNKIESPMEKIRFLQKEFPNWYERTDPIIPGGCIFLMATLEFDDRPGKVKDLLLKQQTELLDYFKAIFRKAIDAGEALPEMSDEHFAFLFYSFYMGFNQYKKFFGDSHARTYFDFHVNHLLNFAKEAKISLPYITK